MKDNKLIAEFMGANPFRESVNEDVLSYEMYGLVENIEDGLNEKHFFLPSEMKYNTSWDWLMPVANEIIKSRDEQNSDWDLTELKYALCTTNIAWVYEAVVEFINEYNKHNL